MYKRFLVVVASVLVLVSGPFTYAEGESTFALSDEQIATIKINCVSVQSTLDRIFTSDASSRVHLGQEYETIASKFMDPMNTRAADAGYDIDEMKKVAASFKEKLSTFRKTYQQYKDTLKRTQMVKCKDQPVVFYDTVKLAEQYRLELRTITVEMGAIVTQYGELVKALRPPVVTAAKSGANKE